MNPKKTAAVLVGHGSLQSESGRAMLQVADLLREQGVVPVVEAGFLNYSQPTLADAVAQAVAQAATRIIVQPYFLIEGHYVRQDLRDAVRTLASTYTNVRFTIAEVLGDHFAMMQLASQRLTAVDPAPQAPTGLLFVAHGTPHVEANAPIKRVLQRVCERNGYRYATVGYLDCNQPTIPDAFDELVATGITRLTVLPYFLHLGRHVRQDLPALFEQARQRHPQVEIRIAHHLDYDPLLVQVTAERILTSMMC